MNKVKKMCLLFCLLQLNIAVAEQHYNDWNIDNDNPDIQISLFMKNEHSEKITISCSRSMYITGAHLPYITEDKGKSFFDYQVDNNSLIFKGNDYSVTWIVPSIWYKDGGNQIRGDIVQYKKLFQQMLKAKESLTVNAIDEKGHIYRSINFSVKGLPEALIEFAKQCGSDFQTYSGIDVNQPNSTKP
ncbi:hypothetical protein RHO14_12055 [Orbus wheelerorum]|uniref:hypothetical protein n=1 Tax=Orbus wheelerorum TaxID=3074111 RepID=UPI00370D2459